MLLQRRAKAQQDTKELAQSKIGFVSILNLRHIYYVKKNME